MSMLIARQRGSPAVASAATSRTDDNRENLVITARISRWQSACPVPTLGQPNTSGFPDLTGGLR